MVGRRYVLTLPVKEGVEDADVIKEFIASFPEEYRKHLQLEPYKTPRVLITVNGGIADYVCDEGVDVAVFDRDNFESELLPELIDNNEDGVDAAMSNHAVPKKFRDLAEPLDVPTEGMHPYELLYIKGCVKDQ